MQSNHLQKRFSMRRRVFPLKQLHFRLQINTGKDEDLLDVTLLKLNKFI